jgi:hypothetical protein
MGHPSNRIVPIDVLLPSAYIPTTYPCFQGLDVSEISSADSPFLDRRARSRITNGSALLPGVDGRSAWARRCRDVISLHIGDLGGADNVSEAECSIIRRCAALTVELEHLEFVFATAGSATTEQLMLYQTVTNSLRRSLEAIGLERRPRDVGPGLGEMLRSDLRSSP